MSGAGSNHRLGTPMRLFWGFSEPFLTSAPDTDKQRGRIPRSVLDLVWRWVGDEVLPQYLPPLEAEVASAIRREAADEIVEGIVRMKRLIGPILKQTLATCAERPVIMQKLGDHIGSPHMIEHMRDISQALSIEPALAQIHEKIQNPIEKPDVLDIEKVMAACKAAIARYPDHAGLIWVAIMQRFAVPARSVRLGHHVLGVVPASKFEASEFGIMTDVLTFDFLAQVSEIEHAHKISGITPDTVHKIVAAGETVATIDREIEVDDTSRLKARLDIGRERLSGLVSKEMAMLPDALETLFAPASQSTISAGPDASLRRRTLWLVQALSGMGPIADQIGLARILDKTKRAAVAFTEDKSTEIIEIIRTRDGRERTLAMDYHSISVSLTESLHGVDAARVVRRLGEAAGTAAVASRKTIAA